MDFLSKSKEFIKRYILGDGMKLIIPFFIIIIFNFMLFFIHKKIILTLINISLVIIIGLIIYFYKKNHSIIDYPLNAFISGYIATNKAPDKKVYNYYDEVIIAYFGSYENIEKMNIYLDPAIAEINSWLIPNNTMLTTRAFNLLNKNKLFDEYIKECIYSYILIGEEDNYWRAICNGLTIYTQDFKKFKNNIIKTSLVYKGIGIAVSFIITLILSSILKNYNFLVCLMLGLLVYNFLSLTVISIFEKKKILEEFQKSTSEVIINHKLSVDIAKKSPAFLTLIQNID